MLIAAKPAVGVRRDAMSVKKCFDEWRIHCEKIETYTPCIYFVDLGGCDRRE